MIVVSLSFSKFRSVHPSLQADIDQEEEEEEEYDDDYEEADIKPGMGFNPFNAEATFLNITRKQRFLKNIWTLSCWYSLKSSHWVLSDEYPCARVSVIRTHYKLPIRTHYKLTIRTHYKALDAPNFDESSFSVMSLGGRLTLLMLSPIKPQPYATKI